eukprot:TRINITY_DN1736_c0_g1_i4.p1 TRINITY_DN1736_c0_g1~~TRINITY_DN1736_c0_g1_i4.p1  ORF type:complete len:214 (-),score=104.17 TRINITY_DN1736_c0_g1_i4:53-604(-)
MSEAPIQAGQQFPAQTVSLVVYNPQQENKDNGETCSLGKRDFKNVNTAEFFAGKRVVLFSVPGAFTPTCSEQHLPGFVANYDALKAKNVDYIICMAVNDKFVMKAWAQERDVGDKILMLADGNANLSKALGLAIDLTGYGMGIRSARFAMFVEDNVVRFVNVEQPGKFEASTAEAVLAALENL